ncbi:hypothetical protein P152DRAFT_485540 [Eremomyces bilateralis CBS 781.70]|uniref:Uncharacterized protein n=1 Tax=Eremomyces bilateralis CBS 781.70 TaxID=1392243 RepID=A0A6G1FRH0_9PEZI|nr:uncharacterized protein P152DRAFT_485540 [Eremomyces bilateralis CBS 781.70]KAF1808373.1 hypothetical protein P152DRAFT_485540 [Eremomyces bilateralis CBS 781.70]
MQFSKLAVFMAAASSAAGSQFYDRNRLMGDVIAARPVDIGSSSSSHDHGYGSSVAAEDASSTEGSPVLPSLSQFEGTVISGATSTATVTIIPIPSGTGVGFNQSSVAVPGSGSAFIGTGIIGTGPIGTGIIGTGTIGMPSFVNGSFTGVSTGVAPTASEPETEAITVTVTPVPAISTLHTTVASTVLSCPASVRCPAAFTVIQTTTIFSTTTVCVFSPTAAGPGSFSIPSVSYSSILPPSSLLLSTGVASASMSMPTWANSSQVAQCVTEVPCSGASELSSEIESDSTLHLTSTAIATETSTSTSSTPVSMTEGSPNIHSGSSSSSAPRSSATGGSPLIGSSTIPVSTNRTSAVPPSPTMSVYTGPGTKSLVSTVAVVIGVVAALAF